MRENVPHHAGNPAPGDRLSRLARENAGAPSSAWPSSNSFDHAVVGTSVMPPRSPFAGRVAHQHETVHFHGHESGTAAQFAFALRHAARIRLGLAVRVRHAVLAPRTQRACRILRRAEGGAEIHHRLSKIPSAARRRQPAREARNFRLGRRQWRIDREEPRDHALDIAVDRRRRRIERDRGDRSRSIGPDARQFAQRSFARGNFSAVRSTTARAQACRLRARA